MKILPVIIIIITLATAFGCSSHRCKCEVREDLVAWNDSIISSLDSQDNWWHFEDSDLRNQKFETYRLMIGARWFGEEPEQYILRKTSNSSVLSYKRYRFDDNDRTYKISHSDSITISLSKWNEFDRLVSQKCFWTMRSDSETVLDGKIRVLEGFKKSSNGCTNRNYHLASTKTGREADLMFLVDNLVTMINSK